MLVVAFFNIATLLTNYYTYLYSNIILKRFRIDLPLLIEFLTHLEVKIDV